MRNTAEVIHRSPFDMSFIQIHNDLNNPDLILVPWTRPFSKKTRVRTTSNSELTVKIISISSTVGNET